MISYQRPLNHMPRVKKIYSKRELFHLDFRTRSSQMMSEFMAISSSAVEVKP